MLFFECYTEIYKYINNFKKINRISKLNLVDLAGSEKISKTGATG